MPYSLELLNVKKVFRVRTYFLSNNRFFLEVEFEQFFELNKIFLFNSFNFMSVPFFTFIVFTVKDIAIALIFTNKERDQNFVKIKL